MKKVCQFPISPIPGFEPGHYPLFIYDPYPWPPLYFILAAGVKFDIAFQIKQKFPSFSLLLTTADPLPCDNFSTPKAKKRAPNGFN